MKSYTDLEQSKKLSEILPLESADMRYERVCFDRPPEKCWYVKLNPPFKSGDIIPCWGLSALLGVLPSATLDSSNDHYYRIHCMERFTEWYDNPIDACYEIILKLKEQNLL